MQSNILHIASLYPNPRDERLGNFVEEHLKAIDPFHKVVVLSAFEADKAEIVVEKKPFLQVQVRYRKKWPILSHYLALRKGYKYLKDSGHQFQLAHLHVCWPSGIVFLGFLKKLPFIITEHYSGYKKERRHEWSPRAQKIALRIFNKAEVFCPVSNDLGLALKDFGYKGDVKVIGNVVNDSIFQYEPLSSNEKLFRLLHISSLQQETKNIKGILNAFAAAVQDDPDLHLSIGGDGDLDLLRKEISIRNIPFKNIEVLGAMHRDEVAHQMAQSNAFLLFSFIENQPAVLLESLCIGRPVIATKVGGIPDFIGSEEGLLVKPNDETGLVQAIHQLKAEYNKYALEGIAKKAKETHSFEAIGKKFATLYASVLPSKP